MTGRRDGQPSSSAGVPAFGVMRSGSFDVYLLEVRLAKRRSGYGSRVQLYDETFRPLLREPGLLRRPGLWRRTFEGAVHAGIAAAYDVHAVMADVDSRLVVWLDDATVVDTGRGQFLTRLDDLTTGGAA